MRIDRLIGILTHLLRTEKATAAALAERFEVSPRTILRDVETLSLAGIPISTSQGGDGGIYIMPGYALDAALLSPDELRNVVAALSGIESVSKTAPAAHRLAPCGTNNMLIDLSSFYRDSHSDKIELLREAIDEHRFVTFRYYYSKGEEDKTVEPYIIMFKWSDWYLYGFCTAKQAFRLYKLKRLWNLSISGEQYTPRGIMPDGLNLGSNITDDYYVTAVFEPSEKYKLIEEYGPSSFTVLESGKLYARYGFTAQSGALSWLLSFGDRVTVIDPPEMVQEIKETAERISKTYI